MCDVPALRAHVGESWQLWNISDGALRPLIDHWPDVQHPESQIWGRRDAHVAVGLRHAADARPDGLWTNKWLPDHVAPVEDVTWVADDGIRYLNPEIVLMYKARLGRLKDTRDLDRAWPLMDDRARDVAAREGRAAAPRPRLARAAVLREPGRPPPARPTWRTIRPGRNP